ncbi:MAG TPA: cyclic nucleotide-binding domain-containing protein, partial [Capsulimonadaceae bacterium]|nr:cyclic nucleotide-binding domain-containing protein [Capsulimonadaceae bacterium]
MDGNNVICLTKKFSLFATLSAEQVRSITPFLRARRLAKYEPIYCPGEPAQFVYLVEEGIVRTTLSTFDGRSLTLAILKAGDLFGEMALIGQSHYSEMSEALRPSTILTIPTTVVEVMMQTSPQLVLHIIHIIGGRRLQIEDTLSSLLTNVAARLARLLLRLSNDYPGNTNQGYTV